MQWQYVMANPQRFSTMTARVWDGTLLDAWTIKYSDIFQQGRERFPRKRKNQGVLFAWRWREDDSLWQLWRVVSWELHHLYPTQCASYNMSSIMCTFVFQVTNLNTLICDTDFWSIIVGCQRREEARKPEEVRLTASDSKESDELAETFLSNDKHFEDRPANF